MTREPGDLIASAGSMAGPIYPRDVIESGIEGIGILRNPVELEKVDLVCARRIGLED